MDESDSSFDKTINEFLVKQGIDINYERETPADQTTAFENNVETLLPALLKVSSILRDQGYSTFDLSSDIIHADGRSLSVFIVDSWASSLIVPISDIINSLKNQESIVQESSINLQRGNADATVFESHVVYLQNKLLEAENKVKALENTILVAGEKTNEEIKIRKEKDAEIKKIIKNLELQVQEGDRRFRQCEVELDRARAKLLQLSSKEKDVESRHVGALAAYRRGDIDVGDSPMKKVSKTKSAALPSRRDTRPVIGNNSIINRTKVTAVTSVSSPPATRKLPAALGVADVIEALESENQKTVMQNKELQKQVLELSGALKKAENKGLQRTSVSVASTAVNSFARDEGGNFFNTSDIPIGISPLKYQDDNWSFVSEVDHVSTSAAPEAVFDVEGARANRSNANEAVLATDAEEELLEQIEHHKRETDKYAHKVHESEYRRRVTEQEMALLRGKVSKLHDEIDNLRLELDNRPTVKQYREVSLELQAVEAKLQDIVTLRSDAAELMAWKKHLSTRDRIKIDKMNHQLGLWLLESLPKSVMKEYLQAACRELDIAELSDLPSCIAKLKAVVATVPHMETFIADVSDFLLQQSLELRIDVADIGAEIVPTQSGDKLSISGVYHLLQRWKDFISEAKHLEAFKDEVFFELDRRDAIMNKELPKRRLAHNADDEEFSWRTLQHKELPPRRNLNASNVREIDHELETALETIRRISDFEVKLAKHDRMLELAHDFMCENPEESITCIISHILYLFNIGSLDGLLPHMNKIYVFSSEMRNFLHDIRGILHPYSRSCELRDKEKPMQGEQDGGKEKVSDQVLLAEIRDAVIQSIGE